jgi:putative membrane protein
MWGNAYYGYPMMESWGYGFSWMHIIFTVFWALLLAFIIISVLDFLRKGRKMPWHGVHGGNAALDILKERYAKGEIDRAEFEEKKKDLNA